MLCFSYKLIEVYFHSFFLTKMKAQTIFSAFINCVIFENKQALDIYVPSTKDVSKVTFVDFLRPAGNFKPIRSN